MKPDEGIQKYPPHLALHYLAGSSSVIALDHAKRLLDAKTHPVNFQNEETGHLTPLHIASHWGNLGMCQLLIHYNANLDLKDDEGNTCYDLAEDKKVQKFLNQMSPTSKSKEKKRLRIFLNELFRLKSTTKFLRRKGKKQHHKQQQRPVSCFPAFHALDSPEVIRKRRSSMLEEEFKAKTENDVVNIIASLTIKENSSIPQPLKKMNEVKPIYPNLHAGLKTPSPPPRMASVAPSSDNITFRRHQTPSKEFNRTPTAPPECSEEEALPSTPDVPLEIRQLSLDELRKRLEKVGISPGPLRKDVRKLYEKRLVVAEEQDGETYNGQEFSNIIDRLLRSIEEGCVINIGKIQEDIIRDEFSSGPIITREKNEVSSFCYLLIDPSKIPDQRNCTFRQFIEAVFYIGKGKRARPLQHLVDAAKCKTQENFRGKPISDKLKRICKLWRSGHGVVSLHIFLNIHPNEALIREAAMIDAFGVKNLTNLKGGEYSGLSKSWPLKEKTEFGAACLYSAWKIYCSERCRPVFESDVADALTQKFFY